MDRRWFPQPYPNSGHQALPVPGLHMQEVNFYPLSQASLFVNENGLASLTSACAMLAAYLQPLAHFGAQDGPSVTSLSIS